MSLADAAHELLGADILVRARLDADGINTALSSKLTAAERAMELSAGRMERSAASVTSALEKQHIAQLRNVQAAEAYNKVLQSTVHTEGQLAAAEARRLTAARQLRSADAQVAAATAAANTPTTLAGRVGAAGGVGAVARRAGGLAAVAAGVGVLDATAHGVHQFEEMTNQVRQLQRVTGATAEDSSKFLHILDRYGLSGDTATQSLARLAKNITETPEKLQQFGVHIEKARNGTTDLTKTLLSANDAFHRIEDPARRDTMALELFGKGGQKLIPILAANRDTLKGFIDEAERSGLVFSQKDLDRARELAIAQKDVTEAWQGAEIALAKGVVPKLVETEHIATRVMQVFDQHPTLARFTKDLAELAVGLVAVNKAIKVLEGVRGSALFTKVLNVGAIEAATVANKRLAESEIQVAEGAAAESAAASGGKRGLLGKLGSVGRALPVIGTVAIAADFAHSVTTGANAGSQRNITDVALSGPQGLAAVESVQGQLGRLPNFGGVRSGLKSQFSAALRQAGEDAAQRTADAAAAAEAAALEQHKVDLAGASQGYFSSIDPNSVPSTKVDRSKLTASEATARRSQVDALSRVRLAEQALNALRSSRTVPSALQLARAEETLRKAKEASATAADKVRGAEKKLGDTRATTALSPAEVAGKLRTQVGFQDKQAKAYDQLVGEGFKAPAIELLTKLDQQAPGTLAAIAAHMTPKLRRQIKASVRQLGVDSSIIADAMDPALRDAAVKNAQTYATTLHGRINRDLRHLFSDAGTTTPLLPGSRGGRDPDIPANPPATRRSAAAAGYHFHGPVTFVDPAAAAKSAQARRRQALSRAQQ